MAVGLVIWRVCALYVISEPESFLLFCSFSINVFAASFLFFLYSLFFIYFFRMPYRYAFQPVSRGREDNSFEKKNNVFCLRQF